MKKPEYVTKASAPPPVKVLQALHSPGLKDPEPEQEPEA